MRTELFVIASTSVEGAINYMGFNSKGEFKAFESPMGIKTGLSHDDAIKIVRAMRKAGLAEGETVKAKSLAQSIRDYGWRMICASKEIAIAGDKKVETALALYPEPVKPEKAEAAKEEVAESVEAETTEKAE